MKKWGLLAICLSVFFLILISNISLLAPQQTNPGQGSFAPGPDYSLPAGLESFYPPKAKEPVFLFKMLELAHSFSGTISDLFENDLPNAQANFEKFKVRYSELSSLIPEWKERYPQAPVEELGTALRTADQGKVIAAIEKVGGVCSGCHIASMARVQQKYGWPSFSAIRTKDPLNGEEVDLHMLMVYLDTSFTGIGADIEQGQAEQAQKQYQGFRARFDTMAGICEDCHGPQERKYYVDSSIRAMIDELGKTISSPTVEKDKAGKIAMSIGMESCHKCHQVHIPAAFAQKNAKK